MTRQRPHSNPEPLIDLLSRCPSAAAIWLALCELAAARGGRLVTPTRAQLRELTGLSEKTISRALTALQEAGWIDRVHVPKGDAGHRATLLRIMLIRSGPNPPSTAAAAAPDSRQARGRRKGKKPPSTTSHRKVTKRPATGPKDRRRRKGKNQPSTAGKIADQQENCTNRKGPNLPPTAHIAVEGTFGPDSRGNISPSDFPTERGGAPTGPPPSLSLGFGPATPLQAQRLEKPNEDGCADAQPADTADSDPPPVPPDLQAILDSIGAADQGDA